jgi:hypothetical protein
MSLFLQKVGFGSGEDPPISYTKLETASDEEELVDDLEFSGLYKLLIKAVPWCSMMWLVGFVCCFWCFVFGVLGGQVLLCDRVCIYAHCAERVTR